MLVSQPKKLLQRLVFSQAILIVLIFGSFAGGIREVLFHVSTQQNAQILVGILSPLAQGLDLTDCGNRSPQIKEEFAQLLVQKKLNPEGIVFLGCETAAHSTSGWGKKLWVNVEVPHGASGRAVIAVHIPEVGRELARLDLVWALSLLLVLALFLVGSYFLSRRWVIPLERLILKTRLIADGADLSQTVNIPATATNDWGDLEHSIEHIKRELESKTKALTQEREELTSLMSAISDAIVAVDTQGSLLFFNSRFALLFGSGPSQRLQSQRFQEVVRFPEVIQAFQKALESGVSTQVQFVALIEKESLERSFNLSISPLISSVMDKPVYGAVGIFHDVTDLKRAEQIRIEFVSNVSHELRTPLTSIKGYTDTLIADFKSGRVDDAGDFLSRIRRNVDRLMSLINDLLDLSSLDNGIELQKTAVNTKELTDRVIAHLEPRRVEKKTTVTVECETPTVLADSIRLEQVLVNLLENAMKYGPEGGTIRVRWEKRQSQTALMVMDNGRGILPEHQARLFERFYRIDKARSRELGGTGLGLAIVKHIMQVHGGTVTVQSEVGKGAEFTCLFPDQMTAV